MQDIVGDICFSTFDFVCVVILHTDWNYSSWQSLLTGLQFAIMKET